MHVNLLNSSVGAVPHHKEVTMIIMIITMTISSSLDSGQRVDHRCDRQADGTSDIILSRSDIFSDDLQSSLFYRWAFLSQLVQRGESKMSHVMSLTIVDPQSDINYAVACVTATMDSLTYDVFRNLLRCLTSAQLFVRRK